MNENLWITKSLLTIIEVSHDTSCIINQNEKKMSLVLLQYNAQFDEDAISLL